MSQRVFRSVKGCLGVCKGVFKGVYGCVMVCKHM